MTSHMQSFIDGLEIPFEGEQKGKQYIVEMPDSNSFSRVFNLISINKNLHIKGDSKATDTETEFRYTDGEYDVVLVADYDADIYRLIVEVE